MVTLLFAAHLAACQKHILRHPRFMVVQEQCLCYRQAQTSGCTGDYTKSSVLFRCCEQCGCSGGLWPACGWPAQWLEQCWKHARAAVSCNWENPHWTSWEQHRASRPITASYSKRNHCIVL